MAKTKFSIEDAFRELELILSDLEDPELGLADSMNLYKKGVKLLDKCSQTLDKTEKELQVLKEGACDHE
ncbi:MAG: exodeoxyribonuclease VII small subunit [Eubacterium sp.]|nr:exodeoxyribonuclease VII small subunit [Eubacterium sp.]